MPGSTAARRPPLGTYQIAAAIEASCDSASRGRRSVVPRRQQRTASPLSAKLKTVGDGQQDGFDTLVADQLAIELVDGATTCLGDPRCPQPPAPQHVVKQFHSLERWSRDTLLLFPGHRGGDARTYRRVGQRSSTPGPKTQAGKAQCRAAAAGLGPGARGLTEFRSSSLTPRTG